MSRTEQESYCRVQAEVIRLCWLADGQTLTLDEYAVIWIGLNGERFRQFWPYANAIADAVCGSSDTP